MRRKARRIFTDGPQLDYVSPWKLQKTIKADYYYLISKAKIMQQIIVPAQLQMQRKNEICYTEYSSASPKKANQTLNQTQSDCKQKHFRKSWTHSAHIEQRYLSDKKQRKGKELQDRIIFVRKKNPSPNIRVVSVGTENQQNSLEEYIFKKRLFFIERDNLQVNLNEKMNRNTYYQKQNSKEYFKRLNVSLMSELKYSKNQKERQATEKLNKTLKQFMKQQSQV